MGMDVSTKRKDNKTIMGHNRHYNQKGDITRSLELQIGDKSENKEQKNGLREQQDDVS